MKTLALCWLRKRVCPFVKYNIRIIKGRVNFLTKENNWNCCIGGSIHFQFWLMMILCEMIKKPGSRWSIQGIISLPPYPFPFSNPPFLLLTVFPFLHSVPTIFPFPIHLPFSTHHPFSLHLLQTEFYSTVFLLCFSSLFLFSYYSPLLCTFSFPSSSIFLQSPFFSFFLSISFSLLPPPVPRIIFLYLFLFFHFPVSSQPCSPSRFVYFPFSYLPYLFPLLFWLPLALISAGAVLTIQIIFACTVLNSLSLLMSLLIFVLKPNSLT